MPNNLTPGSPEKGLDRTIAILISKHIAPESAVGKAIAQRIQTLVSEARKEGMDAALGDVFAEGESDG